MQTDRFQPIAEHGTSIFRRESSLRQEAERILRTDMNTRAEGCILRRFVSAHSCGFVCYDPVERKLTRFYPSQDEAEGFGDSVTE